MPNFFHKKIFGLDISDFSLKMVSLKKEGSLLNLESFGTETIPDGVIEDGRIKNKEILAKTLKDSLTRIGKGIFEGGMPVCSLPEQESFVRVIQLPLMKKEEVGEAIKWEIEANVPYPIEDVYYDWEVIPFLMKDVKHTNVLVAAVPKAIVDDYLDVLKMSDLSPLVLEVECQSVVRSLIKNLQTEHPVIILDMGMSGTGFTIFSGKTICFTAHIDVSGRDIEKAIADACKVDGEEAKKLKIKTGFDAKYKTVYMALNPLLDKLAAQVENYFYFFQERGMVEYAPDGVISKVVLCGGDANLIGLPSFLSKRLQVPVELGDPWTNIRMAGSGVPQLPYNQALTYTTALGLALRSVGEKWV